MGHLAQLKGTGQPRAALERVQRAQHFRARRGVVRTRRPLAQGAAQPGQQLQGLFLEDREEVRVEDVVDLGRFLGDVGKPILERRRDPRRHLDGDRLRNLGRLRHERRNRRVRRGWARRLGHRQRRNGQGFGPDRCGLDGRFADGLGNHLLDDRLFLRWRELERLQRGKNLRIGLLEETGCELVQQTADVLGRFLQNHGVRAAAARMVVQPVQRVFERACQFRQGRETNGCRTACERMRQRLGVGRDGAIRFQRPLRQDRREPARPLVGLVEVDVVERNANAQAANRPESLLLFRRRELRGGLDRLNRRLRCLDGKGLDARENGHLSDRFGWRLDRGLRRSELLRPCEFISRGR